MTKIAYINRNFSAASLETIDAANRIIEEYDAQGFTLTLRQLYYQFVSRDLLPNSQKSYDRLGSIINDARLAGLVSWTAIEDRGRFLRTHTTWSSPGEILDAAARSYRRDAWEGQSKRIEVWIEKDALVGVIEPICSELSLPYYACRGYNSQSEHWRAAQRILKRRRDGVQTVILHLGDHDPSGIDMTRDLSARFGTFGARCEVRRIALNMPQVEEYDPPPNPAKLTDSRVGSYIELYGESSWELDALEPRVIADLIRAEYEREVDPAIWEAAKQQEEVERALLQRLVDEANE